MSSQRYSGPHQTSGERSQRYSGPHQTSGENYPPSQPTGGGWHGGLPPILGPGGQGTPQRRSGEHQNQRRSGEHYPPSNRGDGGGGVGGPPPLPHHHHHDQSNARFGPGGIPSRPGGGQASHANAWTQQVPPPSSSSSSSSHTSRYM